MLKTNDRKERRPNFAVSVVWRASYTPAKTLEREGTVSSCTFYGQLVDYYSHVVSLIDLVDEFFFKETRTWNVAYTLATWWAQACEDMADFRPSQKQMS